MTDKCLAYLLTLAEAARELLNRLPVGDAGQLEIELVRAEDYIAGRPDSLKRHPSYPLTEGSTKTNRKDISKNTSRRPASPPPSPVRIVRPAAVKSSVTLEQIQAAVKKVSKKIKDKL